MNLAEGDSVVALARNAEALEAETLETEENGEGE
jgi:DNA gyrase subunit A